jgi:hypothetical protein
VPVGFDPIGLYAMGIGFDDGYFGIQVNSATQRRILFSIWSVWNTNDPSQVPADYTVICNKKGSNVVNQTFGGEGTGGQSYLVYPWVAGRSYQFLVKASPDSVANLTNFTAWFRDPITSSNWLLIAEWRKPKVSRYLKSPYSFVENFDPNTGNITRMANYTNQWAYNGTWNEISTAKLTMDSTGNKFQRRDVEGGLTADSNSFFLHTNGFFNTTMPTNRTFIRNKLNTAPIIDFTSLP